MPCCFKKDPAISKNKEKKDYHFRCLGKLVTDNKSKKLMGDKLYILQDSNKIQDGRFGYLPDYLDLYLNTMLNNDKIIKNNYLTSSETGWFFKYGSKQDDDIFLSAVANALEITVQQIKDKITNILLKENNFESIFVSLNNGDICTQFGTINSYIRYLQTNFEIEYNLVTDILAIPGVVHDYGLNIIIFEKKIQFIQNEFEKKTFKDDYNIICSNIENINLYIEPNKINIILLKENNNYYPIYQVKKKENLKNIDIAKVYNYESNNKNIINHLYQYIKINYAQSHFEISKIDNAKNTFYKMEKYGLDKYYPTKQIIDKRNKCKYFIIQNKYLLPIKPSGVLFWIPIENNYEPYINKLDITSDIIYDIYLKTNKEIIIKPCGIYYSNHINNSYTVDALIIDHHINIPIIQITMTTLDILNYAKKYKIRDFITESKSIYDKIDKELINFNSLSNPTDKRIIYVNNEQFNKEEYELFRLELAYYFKNQNKLRERIIKLVNKNNIDKNIKIKEIKKILYRLINKQLYDIYINIDDKYNDDLNSLEDTNEDNLKDNSEDVLSSNTSSKSEDYLEDVLEDDSSDYIDNIDLNSINIEKLVDDNDIFNEDIKPIKQKGGRKKIIDNTDNIDNIDDIDMIDDIDNLQMFINTNRRLVNINDIKPNTEKYDIKNNREICQTNTKNTCNINPHCRWKSGSCLFTVTTKRIIKYINKITEELTNNDLKSNELLSKDNYFVSDIVNKEYYTKRSNQKIIKSENNNIKKILSELFGKNNIPIIGKRRMNKISNNINKNNILNPLETIGNNMYQIIHYSNSIYRAYANSYFWIKNPMMEITHRNLGYYSPLQTDLANYFKSLVIDWIINKKNQKILLEDLGIIMNINKQTFINDLKHYLSRSEEILKSYIIDIYILSKINKYIIYLYDNYDNIIGIFENGIQYLSNYNENINKENYYSNKPYLKIKYNISNFSFTNTPSIISTIYNN